MLPARSQIAAVAITSIAVVAIAAYSLARSTIEVPLSTQIRHDDFTFAVADVRTIAPAEASKIIVVHLKVENDALRVGYAWDPSIAYLVDERGRRYAADQRRSSPPTNIGAGDRSIVALEYHVPSDASGLRLAFWDTILMGDVFDGLKYARVRLLLPD